MPLIRDNGAWIDRHWRLAMSRLNRSYVFAYRCALGQMPIFLTLDGIEPTCFKS